MTEKSPELSIIIVNWNGIGFLPNCLRSIVENSPEIAYEVVVVDNDSSDGSPEWLESDSRKALINDDLFRLIRSRSNLGFGRANNLGIESTRSEAVFCLNPDTIVKPGAINRLLDRLRSEDQVGIIGPRLLNENGHLQPSVWAFPPTAAKFLVEGLKLDRLIPYRMRADWLLSRHWAHDEPRYVKVLSGAAMMVKRAMISKIGAFNPNFHMYGEDGEWCLRANNAGWKVLFEPSAEIVHFGGQSAIQRWGENTRLKEEEAFLDFQLSFLSPSQVVRNTLARMVILGLLTFKSWLMSPQNTPILKRTFALQYIGFKRAMRKLRS